VADQIKQELGFDAGQAINALTHLTSALGTASAAVDKFATAVKAFNGSSNGIQQAANSAAQAAGKASNSLNTLGQQGSRSLQRVTLSWQTMSRIVATQLTVRAINQVIQGLEEAARSAAEFQVQVARIGAIAPEQSLAAIGQSVRRLSDDFNTSLADVGKALETVVSNQIETSQQMRVLGSALDFAKVTGADANESSKLLSTTIKALGKNAGSAESIVAQFFDTIDKGQITGKELAHSLGRVIPIGLEAGASFQEINAALQALTIAGVNSNEAVTQLSGLFSALLKPSERLKELFKELGFASGQQLLQIRGLLGTLETLEGAIKGDAEAFGELLPNIRALKGALTLKGEGKDAFKLGLESSQTDQIDRFAAALERVKSTDTEQITDSLNRLSNVFTVEFGQNILKVTNELLKSAGGADTLVAAVRTLGNALNGVLQAFGLVAQAVGTLGSAFANGVPVVGGFFKTLLGFTGEFGDAINDAISGVANLVGALDDATGGALTKFKNSLVQGVTGEFERTRIESQAEAERKADQAALDQHFKMLDAKLDADKKYREANLRTLGEIIVEEQKSYNQRLTRLKQFNDGQVLAINNSVKSIVAEYTRLLSVLDRKIGQFRDRIQDSQRQTQDLLALKEDVHFNFQLGGVSDERTKTFLLLKKSEQTQEKAINDLKKANTQEDIRAARAVFDKATKEREAALAIAESTGDRALQARVVSQIEDGINAQIKAEEKLQEKTRQQIGLAQQEREEKQKELAVIQKQQQIIAKNASLFDSKGNPLSEQEVADRAANVNKAVGKIFQTLEASRQIPAELKAALGNSVLQFLQNTNIKSVSLQTITAAPQALENLRQKIETKLSKPFEINFKAILPALDKFTGEAAKSPADVLKGLQVAEEVQARGEKLRAEASKQESLILASSQQIEGKLSEASATIKLLQSGSNLSGLQAFSDDLEAAKNALALFGKNPALIESQAQLDALKRNLDALKANTESGRFGQDVVNDVTTLLQAHKSLEEEFKAQTSLTQITKEYEAQKIKLQESTALWNFITGKSTTLATDSRTAATNAGTLGFNMSTAGQNTGVAADQMERFLRAAEAASRVRLPAPTTAPTVEGHFRGGYFSDGGLARGADTIPAMVAPGEFIVNSKSAQRFFSQLQAINAGARPVFRDQGGSVTNVGDINVSVHGGSTGRQTARSIAAELRRELRRGTSRL
jgi:TP901 family phage tail tape measure protein